MPGDHTRRGNSEIEMARQRDKTQVEGSHLQAKDPKHLRSQLSGGTNPVGTRMADF